MSGPILVFGAGGQLGQTLLAAGREAKLDFRGLTRVEADLLDEAGIAEAIAREQPRLIVNAAAYTAVDKAESNESDALAGNVTAPHNLASAAARADIPFVHISTDYVFDGTSTRPLVETDPVAPIGVYGRTKAEGEAVVRQAAPKHFILRTAWVYSAFGNNFLKTMLRLAGERDELRVVGDQFGNPTATLDIANAIFALDHHLGGREVGADGAAFGTYHFAGTGITSWHGFAALIVDEAATITGRHPTVTAISTSEYPTPVRRPANSALDSSLFEATFGYRAEPWQSRTRSIVRKILAD